MRGGGVNCPRCPPSPITPHQASTGDVAVAVGLCRSRKWPRAGFDLSYWIKRCFSRAVSKVWTTLGQIFFEPPDDLNTHLI